jgi:lysozyme
MIRGIDIAKWQGPNVDFERVAVSGQTYCFIRATYGLTGPNRLDPIFADNWRRSQSHIVRSAYHFLRPMQPGKDQARFFLDTLASAGGMLEGDLAPVCDIEGPDGAGPSTILKCIEDWMQVVETETKRRPIVYTGPSFWDGYGLGDAFANYPLWVADYRQPDSPYKVPNGWSDWTFFQYTDQGRVPGIPVNVDLNWFNGSLDDLAPLRTGTETTGLDYGRFPKMIRRVKRAFKTMPRVKS